MMLRWTPAERDHLECGRGLCVATVATHAGIRSFCECNDELEPWTVRAMALHSFRDVLERSF